VLTFRGLSVGFSVTCRAHVDVNIGSADKRGYTKGPPIRYLGTGAHHNSCWMCYAIYRPMHRLL